MMEVKLFGKKILKVFDQKHDNRGFSLTELSVSLAIIGVIAGSAISVAITSDIEAKSFQTISKLDRIEQALAGYLVLQKRLPCPANPTTAIGAAGFGLEQVNSGTPDTCSASTILNAGNINGGAVPVRTLQLPDDYMFDGWGRRISYVVDERFTREPGTTTCTTYPCFFNTTDGDLIVKDESAPGGAERTNSASSAIYVIFSHGENGHGAYPRNGGTVRINFFTSGHQFTINGTPLNNAEFDNSHRSDGEDAIEANNNITPYDVNFIMKPFVRLEGGEYYDDIVRFKTKAMMVKEAGEQLYNNACDVATTILNNPSSNACTDADDKVNCESMASELAGLCLQ